MPTEFPFSMASRSLVKEFDAAFARLDSVQFAAALWSSSPTGSAGWRRLKFVTPLVARLRTFADLLTDGGFTVSQEGVANGVFILVTADAREDRKSNGQRGRRSQ
jgi:hypothetical protein